MLLTLSGLAAAAVGDRVALVIGNGKYASAPLVNSVNDSRAMAQSLREMGFTVIERENITSKQIPSTLREFRTSLTPGSVALFFYAGHGLQIKGTNYLPAVDAEINSEDDVPMQSIDLNRILDILAESKTRLNLLFLDACRNNPYARSMRSGVTGLAKVDAPSGTLISFATRPGSTASDGSGGHGVYTEQLLGQMREPNVPVEQVLKRVGASVKRATRGAQEPWMEGSIEGDFYFRGGAAAAVASGPVDPLALELAYWDSVKSSANARDYQAYLDKYPQGQFAGLARERAMNPPPPAQDRAPAARVASRSDRKLVAIVGFENKSTFGADKLWDTSGQLVFSNLMEMGTFRVVEWEKIKRQFDWHDLSTNSLVKSPAKMAEAQKILLTEYFISGAVTQYDVRQTSEVSAMSKKKMYTTNVRVDLQMQDAATGEYLGASNGQSTVNQEFAGDITGGQTGTWDPRSGDDALNQAIQQALKKLIDNYQKNAS
ncbi:MAG TPA: caspase family protein [Usitatibacter sp.]|nr:caspase family protein [Usitatibacter sp.]